jgi:hypothetical protein
MFQEQAFFKGRLHGQPRDNHKEGDHAHESAPHQYRAKQHEQHAEIDRMPDEAVWTAFDEFVLFFEHDDREAALPAKDVCWLRTESRD